MTPELNVDVDTINLLFVDFSYNSLYIVVSLNTGKKEIRVKSNVKVYRVKQKTLHKILKSEGGDNSWNIGATVMNLISKINPFSNK